MKQTVQSGFTLIEILVVMGILSIILSYSLIVSFDAYRGYTIRSERGIIVSILSRARSRAVTNYFQSMHGVCYDGLAKNYILFQGQSYALATIKETTGANPVTAFTSSPSAFFCSNGGVVFTQLSGTSTPVNIVLSGNGQSFPITINYEGTIIW